MQPSQWPSRIHSIYTVCEVRTKKPLVIPHARSGTKNTLRCTLCEARNKKRDVSHARVSPNVALLLALFPEAAGRHAHRDDEEDAPDRSEFDVEGVVLARRLVRVGEDGALVAFLRVPLPNVFRRLVSQTPVYSFCRGFNPSTLHRWRQSYGEGKTGTTFAQLSSKKQPASGKCALVTTNRRHTTSPWLHGPAISS